MAFSRTASNASRFAGHASRAIAAGATAAARSAASLGIDAAREAARITSYTLPTDVLTASDAGDGTATIHVAAHYRVYPVQGNLKVPDVAIEAHDITGQPLATDNLFVVYDDLTMAETAPAFAIEMEANEAANGAAPGRHFVGVISTPAAGAADTEAVGGSSPTSYPYNYKLGARPDDI